MITANDVFSEKTIKEQIDLVRDSELDKIFDENKQLLINELDAMILLDKNLNCSLNYENSLVDIVRKNVGYFDLKLAELAEEYKKRGFDAVLKYKNNSKKRVKISVKINESEEHKQAVLDKKFIEYVNPYVEKLSVSENVFSFDFDFMRAGVCDANKQPDSIHRAVLYDKLKEKFGDYNINITRKEDKLFNGTITVLFPSCLSIKMVKIGYVEPIPPGRLESIGKNLDEAWSNRKKNPDKVFLPLIAVVCMILISIWPTNGVFWVFLTLFATVSVCSWIKSDVA